MSAHASHVSTLIWTLQQEYSLKDLGALTYFLGIHAVRSSQGLHLSQFKYFTELLHLAHMVGAKSCSIPTTSSSKLSLLDGISLSLSEAIEYRQIFLFNIALLLNSTLPSMSTNCANLCTLPLQLTGLLLKESSGISKAPLIIGFFFFFFFLKAPLLFMHFVTRIGLVVLMIAAPLPALAYSLVHALFLGAVKSNLWWLDLALRLSMLFKDLHVPLSSPLVLWCDSVSGLALASNPVFHACTKYI